MPFIGFAVVVILALAVYGVSARRHRNEQPQLVALDRPPLLWTKEAAADAGSPRERLALAARLGLVGDGRSIAILEHALADETDAEVRDAIWRALLTLRTNR